MFTNFLLEIFSNVSHLEIQDTRARAEKGDKRKIGEKKDKYTTVTLTTDCHTDFLGKLYIQIRKMNMNVFLRYFKTKHYQLITLKPTNVCVRCANTEKVKT